MNHFYPHATKDANLTNVTETVTKVFRFFFFLNVAELFFKRTHRKSDGSVSNVTVRPTFQPHVIRLCSRCSRRRQQEQTQNSAACIVSEPHTYSLSVSEARFSLAMLSILPGVSRCALL